MFFLAATLVVAYEYEEIFNLFSVSVTRRSEMYKLPIETSRRAPAQRLCNARLCDSRKSSTIIFLSRASLTALKASGGRMSGSGREGTVACFVAARPTAVERACVAATVAATPPRRSGFFHGRTGRRQGVL